MDLDLGLEIDGCSYDMAACLKADSCSAIVTKMLGEKIPIVYRYIEEGSCFVTDAFSKIEQLCKPGISIPKQLAESMQHIETIYKLSTEAIDAIQLISDICHSAADFQVHDHINIKDNITTIWEQLKDIAARVQTVSEVYIEELNNLRCRLEDVMNDVRQELTSRRLQAADLEDEQSNSMRENFRNATANLKLEATKRSDYRRFFENAGKHIKRCLKMISESMMGPGEASESRNEVGVQQSNYQAFHNLNEEIHLREQKLGEDHEISLRMSILILEAKSVDLHINAVKFLENLCSLSVFKREHEVFYADLPNVLCGLCKMSKEEMDSFKSGGIYLNARWVTIQKACADYIESSIMKTFSREESDSD